MLEIRNLSKTYGNGVRALDDVSLSIPKGMYGLLGPNGAGKSTLMRTIATLQNADKGSIDFNGIDVLKEPAKLRARLGYLPQDFGVYPRMSARALLDHLAILKGISGNRERKRVVEGLLEQTNLTKVAKKSVASYSGGMRQRFGIAQALIGDPQLIIVDEPTAGLDPEERNRFHNLLSEIGENVVVILSTHIVEDVADLCPQMAILNQGRIVAEGAPSDLISQLDGKVWKKRIAKAELPEHRTRHNVISTRLTQGEVLIHVEADASPGEGFEAVAPDLEDVYFATITASQAAPAAA
ncbi:MAG: ATP-binding cassette domain-containing protein [Alphaproteobacteria bacterium]|nr:ATP-binding cassette domain-containing protein [Alphaproteobacteria bacterium]